MKKALLSLPLLVLLLPGYLLISGSISLSTIPMLYNTMAGGGIEPPTDTTISDRFKLPEGFSLSIYAKDLPGVRFMQMSNRGDLLVSRRSGDITLLRPKANDPTVSGERISLLEGLKSPSGLALADGWLYVGESNAVGRVRFDANTAQLSGEYRHIVSGLTDNGSHRSKNLSIGPDQKLYVAQGSTCNACLEEDPRRGAISRFNLDGSGEELYATGLRNNMGMAWAPWSNELYGTDNGRDFMGDDYPPCELNKIEAGGFYGWPYLTGANKPDPDFDVIPEQLATGAIVPVFEFRAHNAPLGLSFVDTSRAWPEIDDRVALVALHGSWNRSSPDGYRVVSLHWRNGEIQGRDFLTGFEEMGDIIGRPVDIAQGADGAIFISDDYAGVIYRVSYNTQTMGEVL